MKCVVKNCVNRDKFKSLRQQAVEDRIGVITYHAFPANEEIREKWISFVSEKSWKPAHDSLICSQHFDKNSFDPNIPYKTLKPYAIPTIPTQLIDYMVYQCYVPGCKNNYRTQNVQLIPFPQEGTNALEFQKWVENIMNFNGATEEHIGKLTSQSKICSEHFEKKCFAIVNGKSFIRSKSLPTLDLPGKPLHQNPFEDNDEVDIENSIVINKVPKCAISTCQSSFTDQQKAFFPFPTELSLNLIWTEAVKDYNKTNNFEYLCSDHFDDDDFEPFTKKKFLKYGAVPSIFTSLPTETIEEILPDTLEAEDDPLSFLTEFDKKMESKDSKTNEFETEKNETDSKPNKVNETKINEKVETELIDKKTSKKNKTKINGLKRQSKSKLQDEPPEKTVVLEKIDEKNKKTVNTDVNGKILTPISKDKIPNDIKKIIAYKNKKKKETDTSTPKKPDDDFQLTSNNKVQNSNNPSESILKSTLETTSPKSVITTRSSSVQSTKPVPLQTKSVISPKKSEVIKKSPPRTVTIRSDLIKSPPKTVEIIPELNKSTTESLNCIQTPLSVLSKSGTAAIRTDSVEKQFIFDKYLVKIPELEKQLVTIAAADSTNNIEGNKSNEKVENWLNEISDENVSSTNTSEIKQSPKKVVIKPVKQTQKKIVIKPEKPGPPPKYEIPKVIKIKEGRIVKPFNLNISSTQILQISQQDLLVTNNKNEIYQNGTNPQSYEEIYKKFKPIQPATSKNKRKTNKNLPIILNKTPIKPNKLEKLNNVITPVDINILTNMQIPNLIPLKSTKNIPPGVLTNIINTKESPENVKKRRKSESNIVFDILNNDSTFDTIEVDSFDEVSLIMDDVDPLSEQNDPLAIDDPPKEEILNNFEELDIKTESPSPQLLSEEEQSLLVPYYEEPIIEGKRMYKKSPIKRVERMMKKKKRGWFKNNKDIGDNNSWESTQNHWNHFDYNKRLNRNDIDERLQQTNILPNIIDLGNEDSVMMVAPNQFIVNYFVENVPKRGHNIITRQKTKKVNKIDPFIIKNRLKKKYDYKISSMVPKIVLSNILKGGRPVEGTKIKVRTKHKPIINDTINKSRESTSNEELVNKNDNKSNEHKRSIGNKRKSVESNEKSININESIRREEIVERKKKKVGRPKKFLENNETESIGSEETVERKKKKVGRPKKLIENDEKSIENDNKSVENDEKSINENDSVKSEEKNVEIKKKKVGRPKKSIVNEIKLRSEKKSFRHLRSGRKNKLKKEKRYQILISDHIFRSSRNKKKFTMRDEKSVSSKNEMNEKPGRKRGRKRKKSSENKNESNLNEKSFEKESKELKNRRKSIEKENESIHIKEKSDTAENKSDNKNQSEKIHLNKSDVNKKITSKRKSRHEIIEEFPPENEITPKSNDADKNQQNTDLLLKLRKNLEFSLHKTDLVGKKYVPLIIRRKSLKSDEIRCDSAGSNSRGSEIDTNVIENESNEKVTESKLIEKENEISKKEDKDNEMIRIENKIIEMIKSKNKIKLTTETLNSKENENDNNKKDETDEMSRKENEEISSIDESNTGKESTVVGDIEKSPDETLPVLDKTNPILENLLKNPIVKSNNSENSNIEKLNFQTDLQKYITPREYKIQFISEQSNNKIISNSTTNSNVKDNNVQVIQCQQPNRNNIDFLRKDLKELSGKKSNVKIVKIVKNAKGEIVKLIESEDQRKAKSMLMYNKYLRNYKAVKLPKNAENISVKGVNHLDTKLQHELIGKFKKIYEEKSKKPVDHAKKFRHKKQKDAQNRFRKCNSLECMLNCDEDSMEENSNQDDKTDESEQKDEPVKNDFQTEINKRFSKITESNSNQVWINKTVTTQDKKNKITNTENVVTEDVTNKIVTTEDKSNQNDKEDKTRDETNQEINRKDESIQEVEAVKKSNQIIETVEKSSPIFVQTDFRSEIIKRASEMREASPEPIIKPNIIDPEPKIKNVSRTYERKNVFPKTIKMDVSKYSKYKFLSFDNPNCKPKFTIAKDFNSKSLNKNSSIKPVQKIESKINNDSKTESSNDQSVTKSMSYEAIVNEIFGDDTDNNDFAVESFIKDTLKKGNEKIEKKTKENDQPSTSNDKEIDTDDECYDVEYLESDMEDEIDITDEKLKPEDNTQSVQYIDQNNIMYKLTDENGEKILDEVTNSEVNNLEGLKLGENQLYCVQEDGSLLLLPQNSSDQNHEDTKNSSVVQTEKPTVYIRKVYTNPRLSKINQNISDKNITVSELKEDGKTRIENQVVLYKS